MNQSICNKCETSGIFEAKQLVSRVYHNKLLYFQDRSHDWEEKIPHLKWYFCKINKNKSHIPYYKVITDEKVIYSILPWKIPCFLLASIYLHSTFSNYTYFCTKIHRNRENTIILKWNILFTMFLIEYSIPISSFIIQIECSRGGKLQSLNPLLNLPPKNPVSLYRWCR